MVLVYKKDIPIYNLDSLESFKSRIAYVFNTIPDMVYISENNLVNLDKLEIFVPYKLIKKEKGQDIDHVFSLVPLKFRNSLDKIDFVKLYILVNYGKEKIENIDSTKVISLDYFISENIPEETFTITSFMKNELESYKKDLDRKIKLNSKKAQDFEKFNEFILSEPESEYSDFTIFGKEIVFETDYEIENNELVNVFNNIVLTKNFLLCFYKSFIKINTQYKNININTEFIESTLTTSSSNYKKNKKDYVYILINKNTILNKPTDEIDWINSSFYLKMEVQNGKLVFISNVTKNLDEKKIIDEVLSLFPKTKIKITKTLEKDINGVFYIIDKEFNNYIFSEMVLNEFPFNILLNKREREKTTKKKKGLYMYFKNPKSNTITPFSIISKKVSQNDPELLTIKDDKILKILTQKDTTYIRVYVPKISKDDIELFMSIFSKLISLYYKNKKEVIKFYKEYFPKFSASVTYVEPKKTKEKIFLRQQLPQIFTEVYTRKCQKSPTIIKREELEEDDLKKLNKLQTIVFPREGEGDPKLVREYACLDKNFKYPGVKENTTGNSDIYPVVPCCYEKDQTSKKLFKDYFSGKKIVIEKQLETQLEIKTNKFVSWSNVGTLDYMPLLSKLFEDIDPEYVYKRVGVSDSKSSFLECLFSALTNIYSKLNEDERKEKTESIRKNLIEKYSQVVKNPLSLCKQTLYDKDYDEIKQILTDPEIYLSPHFFTPLFEEMFKVNIYLFGKSGGSKDDKDEYTLQLPRSEKGYIKYDKTYDKSIYILENFGSESDKFYFPRCELLVRKPRFIPQENILYYFHPNIPQYIKVDKYTKQTSFGNLSELFISKLGLIIIKNDYFGKGVKICFRDNFVFHSFKTKKDSYYIKNDEIVKKDLNSDGIKYEINIDFEIKSIIKYPDSDNIRYLVDSDENIYEFLDLIGTVNMKKISDEKTYFYYGFKKSGVISHKLYDLLGNRVIEQHIDSYGKTRYVNVKLDNGDVITLFTDPLPPLDCIDKPMKNFKFYNKKIDNIFYFIQNNNIEIVTKKIDNEDDSLLELEVYLNGVTFYIPIPEGEDVVLGQYADKIKNIPESSDIKKSLSGKQNYLDDCKANKKIVLFLKEYFIYLYSKWCYAKGISGKKILLSKNIKNWIDENVLINTSYNYQPNPYKLNGRYAIENNKLVVNSKELLIRLVYNLTQTIKAFPKEVEEYYKRTQVKSTFEKKENIEMPEQKTQVVLKGIDNLNKYLLTTFVKDDENVYYQSYHHTDTPSAYRLRLFSRYYIGINSKSLKSAMFTSIEMNKADTKDLKTMKKIESKLKNEQVEQDLRCILYIDTDSDSTDIKPYIYKGLDNDYDIKILCSVYNKEIVYTSLVKENEPQQVFFKSVVEDDIRNIETKEEVKKMEEEVSSEEEEEEEEEEKEKKDVNFPLIKNQGVSCYMNASLQLLFSIPEFKNINKIDFDKIKDKSDEKIDHVCKVNEIDNSIQVLEALKQTFQKMSENKGNEIDLVKMKINGKSLFDILLQGRDPYSQEDATQDFLFPLLTKLRCFHKIKEIEDLILSYSTHQFNTYTCENDDKSQSVIESNLLSSPILKNSSILPAIPIELNLTNSNKKDETDIKQLLEKNTSKYDLEDSNLEICKSDKNKLGKAIYKKLNIKLLDTTKYVIITLLRYDPFTMSKNKKSVVPNKELNIDGSNFVLDGCLLHTGGTGRGHYKYIKYENGIPKHVLDDSEYYSVDDEIKEDINKEGYVFLYKKTE